jgi:hypothetical protein
VFLTDFLDDGRHNPHNLVRILVGVSLPDLVNNVPVAFAVSDKAVIRLGTDYDSVTRTVLLDHNWLA